MALKHSGRGIAITVRFGLLGGVAYGIGGVAFCSGGVALIRCGRGLEMGEWLWVIVGGALSKGRGFRYWRRGLCSWGRGFGALGAWLMVTRGVA